MHLAPWGMDYDRGLGSLARHDAAQAVRSLQKALAACPPSRPHELHRISFYLGVALRRAGYSQSAIRSWLSCQRLNKRGHTRRMLARLTNGYGMEKQACEELDDWTAFVSLQLSRYLLAKNRHGFATRAERDMVTDLVRDHWRTLGGSGALVGTKCCEKLDLFRKVRIVFPTVLVDPSALLAPVISVNFQAQRRVNLTDRCSCGSGLPFIHCCGRTPGREEIQGGLF
jgi:hypothetical protein